MKKLPSFRLTLAALAVMGASLAWAQTEPAAEASAQTPAAASEAPAQKMHKAPHRKGARKYATPEQHEAAAVRGEQRRGKGPADAPMDVYERNALSRCDVFKTADDRAACIERVRQAPASGSVEEGGVLRKYIQTMPASSQ